MRKPKGFNRVTFIVPLYDDGVTTVAVVSADTIHREEAWFLDALQKALTAWFGTKSGRAAWRTSCADFNVGDLGLNIGSVSLRKFLSIEHIHNLTVTIGEADRGGQWVFDKVLGDGGELDA